MAGPLKLTTGVASGLLAGWVFGRAKPKRSIESVLNGNYEWMSPAQRKLVGQLMALGQDHLFCQWPPPGVKDNQKLKLLEDAAACLKGIPGALEEARLDILEPPVAEKRPHRMEIHGDVRDDPYYWMRDDERKDPAVLDHLKRENDYAKAAMADSEGLQEELFREMKGRIKEDDQSAPQRDGPYFYYSRTLEGKQYSVHCRRKIPRGMGAPSEADEMDTSIQEEILLDENVQAAKCPFYDVGCVCVSPNDKLMAYTEDLSGNAKYTLHVKDLETGGELLQTPIHNLADQVTWAMDNRTIFYVTQDKQFRANKVWRLTLGANGNQSTLVFNEEDEAFMVTVSRSRDDKMIMIWTASAVTSEIMYLDAGAPTGSWSVLLPRTPNVEYTAKHRDGYFYCDIRDERRPNSELIVMAVGRPDQQKVLIPHRYDVKLECFCLSENHLAVFERSNALQSARIFRLPSGGGMPNLPAKTSELQFEEPAYELMPGGQGEFRSDILRIVYSSLTTPASVIDCNMTTGKRCTKKVQAVLGDFNSANYKSERLWATAPDMTDIPISLVYRKDLVKLDASAPLLLLAYGSYEVAETPCFSMSMLSLLDRGFIYAIAHVRGGGEMGRHWYEDGKYLRKKNTFTDTIACAEHLIKSKYCKRDGLCLTGRSAGGMTAGAVLNMRPDLFSAALIEVPFVDVLTTMLDESIPLTTTELEEWGNPKEKRYYDYMKSYSPMDNVVKQEYPDVLVTTGLHDPNVCYWEPAKYAAKLREYNTGNGVVLLHCDMHAGHHSKSGRFDVLKEAAFKFAFLLKVHKSLLTKPSS
ncbi:unnamed protein product [Ostreobium quekettii]|uniref:Prolyl endopeptidase n=1 Tax=Ostreobium quekettii TaxID=121088 RepID=A0A8S1IRV9_9CHLO|nr:unnamed protein product [Ostreobium quekettii]|eukprot:evm.model.scf_1003.4 EVM.evm.TU.scf_1003.4   scf_1003:33014-48012(-)